MIKSEKSLQETQRACACKFGEAEKERTIYKKFRKSVKNVAKLHHPQLSCAKTWRNTCSFHNRCDECNGNDYVDGDDSKSDGDGSDDTSDNDMEAYERELEAIESVERRQARDVENRETRKRELLAEERQRWEQKSPPERVYEPLVRRKVRVRMRKERLRLALNGQHPSFVRFITPNKVKKNAVPKMEKQEKKKKSDDDCKTGCTAEVKKKKKKKLKMCKNVETINEM